MARGMNMNGEIKSIESRLDIDKAIQDIKCFIMQFDPRILPMHKGISIDSEEAYQPSLTMHVIRG